MSIGAEDDGPQPEEPWPPAAIADRLGFLLKHTQLRFVELLESALVPLEVDGREFAVLTLLAGEAPLSQQQAARRLRVDRTTMVAFVDGLESRGLVQRRPDRRDRRRNVVEVTAAGRESLRKAALVVEDAERRFLAPLGREGGEQLRTALRQLLSPAVAEQSVAD